MKDFYKAALECRNNDATLKWTVFSVMTAINSALLIVVMTKGIDDLLKPLLCAFGAIMSIISWGMSVRLLWCLACWEGKLGFFERFVKEEAIDEYKKVNSAGLTSCERDQAVLFKIKDKNDEKRGFSTRICIQAIPLFFLAIWIILGLHFSSVQWYYGYKELISISVAGNIILLLLLWDSKKNNKFGGEHTQLLPPRNSEFENRCQNERNKNMSSRESVEIFNGDLARVTEIQNSFIKEAEEFLYFRKGEFDNIELIFETFKTVFLAIAAYPGLKKNHC